jgi:hypothetical protein
MNSTSDFFRPSISFVSEMLRFTNRIFKQRLPAADLKLFLHFSFNLFYFRPRGHFLSSDHHRHHLNDDQNNVTQVQKPSLSLHSFIGRLFIHSITNNLISPLNH